MKNFLRKPLYNFFRSEISSFLCLFSSFSSESCLISDNDSSGKLYIIWAIDVEGGYIDQNLNRIWMREDPKGSQGFFEGFKLWQNLFDKYSIPATFFISSQGFYFSPKKYRELIKKALISGHEIGYHLHLAEDQIIQSSLNFLADKNSSRFYNHRQLASIFQTIRSQLNKYLGKRINNEIISFRWGNWGLNSTAVFNILKRHNFMIDSSALPGQKGHLSDDRFYDWTGYEMKTFPKKINGVWEIPTSTFIMLNIRFKADPLFGHLLKKFIEEQSNLVIKTKKSRLVVIFSHSSEIVTKNKQKSYLCNLTNDVLWALKPYKNIEYLTMNKFVKTIY